MLSCFSRVWLFATWWTIARDSSSKNTWVGCHAIFQGIFPTHVTDSHLESWQVGSFLLMPPGKLHITDWQLKSYAPNLQVYKMEQNPYFNLRILWLFFVCLHFHISYFLLQNSHHEHLDKIKCRSNSLLQEKYRQPKHSNGTFF